MIPKVEYNKIITIKYKDPEEPPIQVCIADKNSLNEENIRVISAQTPMAKAILNRSLGDEVDMVTPGGTYRIVISQID